MTGLVHFGLSSSRRSFFFSWLGEKHTGHNCPPGKALSFLHLSTSDEKGVHGLIRNMTMCYKAITELIDSDNFLESNEKKKKHQTSATYNSQHFAYFFSDC